MTKADPQLALPLSLDFQPIKFIDLFAGIGGFHFAFDGLEHEFPGRLFKCVFASERDEAARLTYQHNFQSRSPLLFPDFFNSDITLHVDSERKLIAEYKKLIPDFQVLCAGFPCQPFSHAGFKKGFADPRGTLFGNIASIIKAKQPDAYILENVSHLYKHDNGDTFRTIQHVLEKELKYSFHPKIIRASDFGLPQLRPRLFMVGFRKRTNPKDRFAFPDPVKKLRYTMSDIFGGGCTREVGYTLRVGGRGSGVHDRRNWDSYVVDGKVRRLGPQEGMRMMGLPDYFRFPATLTETQKMKQLGNSVAVPVVQAVLSEIVKELDRAKSG